MTLSLYLRKRVLSLRILHVVIKKCCKCMYTYFGIHCSDCDDYLFHLVLTLALFFCMTTLVALHVRKLLNKIMALIQKNAIAGQFQVIIGDQNQPLFESFCVDQTKYFFLKLVIFNSYKLFSLSQSTGILVTGILYPMSTLLRRGFCKM